MTKKILEDRTALGLRIEQGLKEALAWKRGEIALQVTSFDPATGERMSEIRTNVVKTQRG